MDRVSLLGWLSVTGRVAIGRPKLGHGVAALAPAS